MSKYVLYTAAGTIKQVLMLPDGVLPVVPYGLTSLEVDEYVDGRTHHIYNGAVVAGVLDVRTLADRQLQMNAKINAWRQDANYSSFSYAGKSISCSPLSRSDIDAVTGIVSLTGELPLAFPGGWKAMDNTYIPISSVADWRSFYAAMVAQGTENFARSQVLKGLVAAATELTISEVEALTWA